MMKSDHDDSHNKVQGLLHDDKQKNTNQPDTDHEELDEEEDHFLKRIREETLRILNAPVAPDAPLRGVATLVDLVPLQAMLPTPPPPPTPSPASVAAGATMTNQQQHQQHPLFMPPMPATRPHALYRAVDELEQLHLDQTTTTATIAGATVTATNPTMTGTNNTNAATAAAAAVLHATAATTAAHTNNNHSIRMTSQQQQQQQQHSNYYLDPNITMALTSLVTQQEKPYTSAHEALHSLTVLGSTIPRRVCQFPFKRNDIVWVCRTCQADETCVLCHACYSQSNHEGHDVAFYHAQAGGCCDCGDPDAWSPDGFCPHHGTTSSSTSGTGLPPRVVQTVQCMVETATEWLVEHLCTMSMTAHERTKISLLDDASSDFVPQAASASKSRGDQYPPTNYNNNNNNSHATRTIDKKTSLSPVSDTPLSLGDLARSGNGLYLILAADDVHTKPQVAQSLRTLLGSYFTDSLLSKMVSALGTHGQLIVYGTMEWMQELSLPQRLLFHDGDVVTTRRVGTMLLTKAALLQNQTCSIKTRTELLLEQRAETVLEWLTALARSCDPLCQTVAESIRPAPHLVPMLTADFYTSCPITKAWHSLLLTLLAVPTFKSHLAAAYCDTYATVTSDYAKGMGVLERSSYTLSVQFLNRVTYVVDLVQTRNLLGKLGRALLETLLVAAIPMANQNNSNGNSSQARARAIMRSSSGNSINNSSIGEHDNDDGSMASIASTLSHSQLRRLNPNHYVLAHRRYSPCVSDLKCVLNVKGMARLFASSNGTFLQDWLSCLALAQQMDGQVWRTVHQGHVETEPRGWVGAFNASISLGSLFERLLHWDDNDPSPAPQSILSNCVPTIVELTLYCLQHGLGPWQEEEIKMMYNNDTKKNQTSGILEADYALAPASLPYATVYTGHHVAFPAFSLTQVTPWSFHLPLHRYVAACLREVCRRQTGMMELLSIFGIKNKASSNSTAFATEQTAQILNKKVSMDHDTILYGLVEFPLIVLSRSAQVRAGLWKRNGMPMFDQVLNYAEPPFCRPLRDSDILLIQFASLAGRGTGSLVTLMLHRFGLFDFCGFAAAPSAKEGLYREQVEQGCFPGEINGRLPWTYSPTKDAATLLSLLEEFLHLLIVMITEIPSIPPKNKSEHTAHAKQRLRREVIHRLASGPKTHSELAEVHHVLSNWDNVFLSEEGKLVNPDDATGAALGATLMEVAEHKSVRGKLEPNQWVLKESIWEEYDPAFYHISLRSHQGAAENKPSSEDPKCFAPRLPFPLHPSFARLRRDFTSDATVLAVTYRTLHVHCRQVPSKDQSNLKGLRYPSALDAMSETALARSIHILTLGCFAWESATDPNMKDWESQGGSYDGSVFYHRCDGTGCAPTISDWIEQAMLVNPSKLMDCEWYEGEDNALLLLKRLAVDGGSSNNNGFCAQDQSIKSGAAWLCDFCSKHNPTASNLLGNHAKEAAAESEANGATGAGESELDRKKREAKARAMEKMNAQAARFAAMMQIDTEDSEEEKESEDDILDPLVSAQEDEDRRRMSSSSFLGSETSFATAPSDDSTSVRRPSHARLDSSASKESSSSFGDKGIPQRLLKSRPICIICNDDSTTVSRDPDSRLADEDDGIRKRSRRKTDRSNALAFVGYAQPSTVLKGGGGTPPTSDNHSALSCVRRFVGVHVALCGHAVHSECCESYLATVHHREDRVVGRREEFKCPLCQRLSNCLVPFIDVGVDWIDPPLSQMKGNAEFMEEYMDLDDASIDALLTDAQLSTKQSLDMFLHSTPWWVGRDDSSVVWDGQSAFVAAPPTSKDESGEFDLSLDASPSSKVRRRSVRSLRKKDLYAAWSAMMRTPRFIRRRQLQRSSSNASVGGEAQDSSVISTGAVQMSVAEDSSMGETLVWRRFMDLLSDMAYRADVKRLGEQHFLQYCGEFRHYQAEKNAHNSLNRLAGRESADWPACISPIPLPDNRRQELSREKLLSKLLMSIQSFTYSCCSETYEVKRLLKKEFDKESDDGSMQKLYSMFGIAGLACDDQLILIPSPSAELEDGTQPFDGRLGKLRYLGLAVMATAGAVAADLVQLVLGLPLSTGGVVPIPEATNPGDPPERAPVVFPILFGHVLTHVVAAMCATSGRARARSDSLELVWPAPFFKRGSFYSNGKEPSEKTVDGVVKDCGGFIKLGLLARTLQVLLGMMQIEPSSTGVGRRVLVIKCIRQALESKKPFSDSESANQWLLGCAALLDASLSEEVKMVVVASATYGSDVISQFKEACQVAADAAVSFLADAGAIFQILIPGVSIRQDLKKSGAKSDDDFTSMGTLNTLITELGLEPMDDMLKSDLVRRVVANWFRQACTHSSKTEVSPNDATRGMIQKRLFQTETFRVKDWPMYSCRAKDIDDRDGEKKMSAVAATQPQDSSPAMQLDSYPSPMRPARVELRSSSGPLVSFSSRKSVHLIGGYTEDRNMPWITMPRPRIYMLPTSYTDLYAELGVLCPDSEQTALCLICGEVLNANGKGECTKHSFKCGAGACIFFLLQECQGLIMHGGKAVYVQSPYVDSHGETPQYRGRPLNLDLDRYDIFRELWTGHGIRQKVVQARGNAKQVIITDFY